MAWEWLVFGSFADYGVLNDAYGIPTQSPSSRVRKV